MIPPVLIVPLINGAIQIIVKVLELTLKPTEKFSLEDQEKIIQKIEKNGKLFVSKKGVL